MKLSIIIPVYKVENTLRRCVESVLRQAYKDYQIILVDDASPDKCPEICDELVKNEHRVQVIHRKKNGGLSAARNSGIQKAKGEYIMFLDSDDFMGNNTLPQLMEILGIHHEYDILEFPVWEHYGNPKKQHRLIFKTREYMDVREYWLKERAYEHCYAWNKVYRKELFGIARFPERRCFEDVFTLPRLLTPGTIVATTGLGLYYYRDNPNGITALAKGKELNDLLEAHLEVLNNPKLGYDPTAHYSVDETKLFGKYYAHILNIQMDVYEMTGDEPRLPMLPFRNTFKLKLLHILGIKNLCKLNKTVHKIIRIFE